MTILDCDSYQSDMLPGRWQLWARFSRVPLPGPRIPDSKFNPAAPFSKKGGNDDLAKKDALDLIYNLV